MLTCFLLKNSVGMHGIRVLVDFWLSVWPSFHPLGSMDHLDTPSSQFTTNTNTLMTPAFTLLALSPLTALPNHSCLPNVVAVSPSPSKAVNPMRVIASQEIQPEGEVNATPAVYCPNALTQCIFKVLISHVEPRYSYSFSFLIQQIQYTRSPPRCRPECARCR